MSSYIIGYGKGEIEPKIAPLVDAVRSADLVTFSSCEGHVEDQSNPRFASIAFYAHEDEAKDVHSIFLNYRQRLKCSWIFHGSFVIRDGEGFVLGWTLENCGIVEHVDPAQFVRLTVETGWNFDIAILVEMFTEFSARKANLRR
jgi:hypothetical protein